MRLEREHILSMLEMQANMNTKINPAWLEAGYPFLRAVVVESAEAMEHYGWKWWRHQAPNPDQLRLEIVDIWHFVLSAILVNARGDCKVAADWLEKRIAALDAKSARKVWVFEREYRLEGMSLMDKLELLIGISAFRKIRIPLIDAILDDCGMSWADLYRQYIGKNVLNLFRQDHGYKTGAYRKHWHDGREDNAHLSEILDDMDFACGDPRSALYAALSERYAMTA